MDATESLPWQPLQPGFSIKVLRAPSDAEPRAALLRLEPGTVIALHRHTGDVHAINLQGTRKILTTGELVGPGQFVYEPTGNVDSWMAIGDEPCIIFVVVTGAIEYIGKVGEVLSRSTNASAAESYRRYCDSLTAAA
jgi:anti-sigma factor ChrR (cupin superfamily)